MMYRILFIFLLHISVYSQYIPGPAPLTYGNLWSYNESLSSAHHVRVLDSLHTIDGKVYNVISSYYANSAPYYYYCRLREDSMYVRYNPFSIIIGEYEYFKLNLKKGDIWSQMAVHVNDTVSLYHIVVDTGYYPWFGELIPVKSILITDSVLVEEEEVWSEKYGRLREFREWHAAWLWGCVIDGVVYGDTTLVEVEDSPLHQRKEFTLFQNYPNPFNPSTSIIYEVANTGHVTLKVYDVLGNEIACLVNEEKKAGKHKTLFDASGLPSGIYLCTIISGGNKKSIKMILTK